MQKMNVIAKISCYLERSVVTLKLRNEYLNTVTRNTPVLLWIKNWTVWYRPIERYSMSTYTGVTNYQKTVRFFGPLCIARWKARGWLRIRHNWTFFRYLLRLRRYKRKAVEVFRSGVGHFERKFQTEGASPTNHCWCQKTRVIASSCGRL